MLICLLVELLEHNKFGPVKTPCFNNFIDPYTRPASNAVDLNNKAISIETIYFE